MEVSGQLDGPATLPPEQEGLWTPQELVWMLWRRERSFGPGGNQTPVP